MMYVHTYSYVLVILLTSGTAMKVLSFQSIKVFIFQAAQSNTR